MRLLSKPTLLITLGASLMGACKAQAPETNPEPPAPPPPTETMGLELTSVDSVAQDTSFWSPLDAAPSPEGDMVYFTASTEMGASVLSVPAAGGAATVLYAGDLLAAPFGVVPSLDGSQLFIADTGTQDEELDDTNVGGIFTMATSGGDPALVAGTENTQPRSLHLSELDGQEVLHYTGVDPATGEATVYRLEAAGGTPVVVASGAPLTQPSGIVVDSAGIVYVADSAAVEDGTGAALLKVKDGQIELLLEGIRLGYPAGLSLDKAETTLLASGLANDADTSVVHALDLTTMQAGQVSDGIGHNSESGGVHRAHNANVFAWANSDGSEHEPAGGNVYVLKAAP